MELEQHEPGINNSENRAFSTQVEDCIGIGFSRNNVLFITGLSIAISMSFWMYFGNIIVAMVVLAAAYAGKLILQAIMQSYELQKLKETQRVQTDIMQMSQHTMSEGLNQMTEVFQKQLELENNTALEVVELKREAVEKNSDKNKMLQKFRHDHQKKLLLRDTAQKLEKVEKNCNERLEQVKTASDSILKLSNEERKRELDSAKKIYQDTMKAERQKLLDAELLSNAKIQNALNK